jgi:hypothetical protein
LQQPSCNFDHLTCPRRPIFVNSVKFYLLVLFFVKFHTIILVNPSIFLTHLYFKLIYQNLFVVFVVCLYIQVFYNFFLDNFFLYL